MFALIFWLSTAAFTVLWAVTGGEWWGFGVCMLLAVRVAMLCAMLCACCNPDILLQQRLAYRPPSASVRGWDYALDFSMLFVLGWIATSGARYAILALGLYIANVLVWELLHSILTVRQK